MFTKIYDRWLNLNARKRHSISAAASIFAFLSALVGIAGVSLDSMYSSTPWYVRLLAICILFILVTVAIYYMLGKLFKDNIKLQVRGIPITIKSGDIFTQKGLKIIPFNEHYDTLLDGKTITRNTLNGIFLEKYAGDIQALNQVIERDAQEHSIPRNSDGKFCFELGHIILYEDYLLLAFSKFDEQHRAHLSMPEYESCLFHMWTEVRRVYGNQPISLPLIGGGITSFDGVSQKEPQDLLRCILCTLRTSSTHINQAITILLNEENFEKIDMYEMRDKMAL